LVPRKKDLKELSDGPSRNFWFGIEEDKYLETSVLKLRCGDDKKLHRGDWHASRWFLETTYIAFVGT
jgi:hypothetical protein